MALRTPPSWLQNGSHPAEQDRLTTQGLFRTSGVLYASDLAVAQSTVPAMSVQIATGWGNIIGTTQANMGAYQYYNDAAATATITTADVTNPRIDLICITINDAYYVGSTNNVAINVVAGTPAGSPAVPALPANSYALAQVAVAANATTIVTANITDLRQVSYPVNTKASAAGSNAIINGGMDIWQRGTSFPNPAGTYTADRWIATTTGTCTVSQITSSLPNNFRYGIQWVAGAASSYIQLKTFIETANLIPLQGKTVTISGWVKASANYVGNWLFQNYYSTTSDASAGVTTQNGGNVAIATSATTTWTFFSITFTVPATALGLGLFFIPDNAAQVNTGTIQMTGIQLELGSTATTFSRAGGSIGGELALCQRYYRRYSGNAGSQNPLCSAFAISTVSADGTLPFSVPMRVAPTSNQSAVADLTFTWSAGTSTTSAVSIDLVSADAIFIRLTTTGLTVGQGGYIRVETGTNKYFELSAEL